MGKVREEYEVVLDSTPTFLEYVIGIGTVLKYFLIMMLVMSVIVFGSLAIYILFGEGWRALGKFILDIFRSWDYEALIVVIVMAAPFVAWWYFSKYMMKHYKADRFMMKSNEVIIMKKEGTKLRMSYPVLKEHICREKIHIGPDWISIPCEQGKIRFYSQDKECVKTLIQNLAERCDLPISDDEMLETIREYMIGWVVSYLFGIPCVLLGCYVSLVAWIGEEGQSWSRLGECLFSTDNVCGVIGIAIIFVGYMLKCIYYGDARAYFAPYKEWLRVSW